MCNYNCNCANRLGKNISVYVGMYDIIIIIIIIITIIMCCVVEPGARRLRKKQFSAIFLSYFIRKRPVSSQIAQDLFEFWSSH